MMHHVPQAGLTALAVAGPVERDGTRARMLEELTSAAKNKLVHGHFAHLHEFESFEVVLVRVAYLTSKGDR
jgi:hypothetical protein